PSACFEPGSLWLQRFSSRCRCADLVSGTLSKSNGSWTIITVPLAPTNFANDNPFVTACSANSDPSVGMRICRYMVHLSILVNVLPCNARVIASDSPDFSVQFLEQNQLIRQSCRRPMYAIDAVDGSCTGA